MKPPDVPQAAPMGGGINAEVLTLFRIDLNAARMSDGKACVLMVLSTPGAHMTVALPVEQVEPFVEELRKQARQARSGLHVPPPGFQPPTVNGKR